MEQGPPESDEQREGMPKAAKRSGMPKKGALFRRTERVRRTAALARAVDEARAEGEAAAGGEENSAFAVQAHVSESEAEAREGVGAWVSGPALRAYQDPPHVGIRARLGVTEKDAELLDYAAYPAARR